MKISKSHWLAKISICVLFYASAHADDWTKDALRLSGESNFVYQKALNSLARTSNLDEMLKAALSKGTTETYLALDVIVALKRDSLFSSLLENAKRDQSGFFFIALNSFFNSRHHAELLYFYLDQLNHSPASPAEKMVILDTLGRIHFPLPIADLKKIMENGEEPEVRSAGFYYLRAMMKTKDPIYPKIFADFFKNFRPEPSAPEFAAQMQSMQKEFPIRGDR